MKTVVVIGGGITGLTTMHYLQKLKKQKDLDINLILVEKDEQLGGKIKTVHDEEFIIEAGADSMVARHESVMPLVQDLQLEEQLVYNATGISYIYTNDELHPIPADTIFGIPTSVESLYNSSLVSEEGKQAALKDLETKNETFTKESSIGSFLEYFLGKELVEKQIAPVLSGVYSGNIYELTLASTLPYLLDYKNKFGSIIKGLEENKKQFQGASDKKFISFNAGLSTIINKIEEKLKECTILKGVQTTSVRKVDEKYQLTFSNHDPLEADYVVLSTPHDVTQHLLNNEQLDRDFNDFKNSSLISIYLGFDIPDEELPADGTGFIVSENSNLNCNACTWTSRKWEHTSANHNLLVRLFYKSSSEVYSSLKKMDEEELVEAALQDIHKSLGLHGKPKTVQVTNWDDLMPNYHLNHSQAVNSLTENMSDLYPNVILAGCSYYGVGIGACIKNGQDTAEEIVSRVTI
ncbi:protoporphyrinogen oxidase [Alkalihalobacterium elongatum]|uniref:protoporphyrinogen oxidase n=1 Tax=Alkalihalobacterium elongatum TaxID=2675466 RepID=UPI001C1F574A|nr:protoporphyrinogen oxidase [Alkalihalobacterium elongatum]